MMSKRDIAKIVKRIIRQQRGFREHQLIHPRREWSTGLLIGFLALVGGATWSYLTYHDVSDKDASNINAEAVEQNVYQEGLVNNALNIFESRNEKYQTRLEMAGSYEFVPEPEIVEEEVKEESSVGDEVVEEVIDVVEESESEVVEEVPVEPVEVTQ